MSSESPHQLEPVGVIDVGSNTIKLLVASFDSERSLQIEYMIVEETRIGEGVSGHPPTIDANAIARGAEAIQRLAEKARSLRSLSIVATSAVRDAENKTDFINEVEKRCGHELRVLSGDEEARLIGIGLQHDPALRDIGSFTLMDLGGGSLECIHFLDYTPTEAESLRLGSVRLASALLEDRARPLGHEDERKITDYVKEQLLASRFERGSSPSDIAVLTGGSASHLGETIGDERRKKGLSLKEFQDLKAAVCGVELERRVEQFDIPRSRADIFPTAMVTLEECLLYFGCERIRFSHYNLRYGVAALLLEKGALQL